MTDACFLYALTGMTCGAIRSLCARQRLRRFSPRPLSAFGSTSTMELVMVGSVLSTCKLGLEGIVSKRKDSTYRSGRSPDWLKMKNPACEAVSEAEEDWGRWG